MTIDRTCVYNTGRFVVFADNQIIGSNPMCYWVCSPAELNIAQFPYTDSGRRDAILFAQTKHAEWQQVQGRPVDAVQETVTARPNGHMAWLWVNNGWELAVWDAQHNEWDIYKRQDSTWKGLEGPSVLNPLNPPAKSPVILPKE